MTRNYHPGMRAPVYLEARRRMQQRIADARVVLAADAVGRVVMRRACRLGLVVLGLLYTGALVLIAVYA